MKNISKLFLLLVFTLFCSLGLFGQTKIVTQATSNSEIDKLYNLYKDKKTISISTPHGNLDASVGAYTNDEGKPKHVGIAGTSKNESAIVTHLVNTINMKIKQGYRPIENYTRGFESYSTLIRLKMQTLTMWTMRKDLDRDYEMAFRKGQMTFLVRVGLNIKIDFYEINGLHCQDEKMDGFLWYIKITDTNREAGPSGSEFVF